MYTDDLSLTDDLLRQIAQRIADAFHPEKIILFGSCAYGQPGPGSDVDLLVIMESQERQVQRALAVSALLRPWDLPWDIVVRTPAEIDKSLHRVDPFIHEILAKGKVLYPAGETFILKERASTEYAAPSGEEVQEWVAKAEEDYRVALILARRKREPLPDAVCFHCQQCVEKYLKAYLLSQGIPFPKTHSLLYLLRLCQKQAAEFELIRDLLEGLDKYAVRFRYPGQTSTVQDAVSAVRDMGQIRDFIRAKLAPCSYES